MRDHSKTALSAGIHSFINKRKTLAANPNTYLVPNPKPWVHAKGNQNFMRKTIGGEEGTLNFVTHPENDESRFDTEMNDKCDDLDYNTQNVDF